ncbi:MAG: hypothetical protein LBS37_00310 [Treponema sp.]|jgi:hypothetical protein|nr:hypothetical protein [Treponema sp.]
MKGTVNCMLLVIMIILMAPVYEASAQTTTTDTTAVDPTVFNTKGFPQWAKDLRRWEIVAFGSFPFTMFATTFAMDTRRWIDENGMDWSESGRRYAPWPLKTAGAIDMSNKEHETTLIVAASISVALAFTDLIIVQIKRHKERRRAESLPAGSNVIINKTPWPEGSAGGNSGSGGNSAGTTIPAAP